MPLILQSIQVHRKRLPLTNTYQMMYQLKLQNKTRRYPSLLILLYFSIRIPNLNKQPNFRQKKTLSGLGLQWGDLGECSCYGLYFIGFERFSQAFYFYFFVSKEAFVFIEIIENSCYYDIKGVLNESNEFE